MLEARIDEVDDEGAGVGHADGLEIHVAFALPGERVRAVLEHKSPHAPRAWARLAEVLEPSPARRPAPCPAFGRCGGCALGHATYPEQLRLKRERVQRALGREPALRTVSVEECLAAPAEVGYRDQAKYVLARRRGRLRPCSYAPRSHRPVDMTGCLVPEPEVQAAAEAVAAAAEEAGLPPYDERTRTGLVRHVVARASADGRVLVVVVAAADFPGATALAQAVRARRPAVAGVVLDVNPTRGGTILSGAGRLLGGVDTLPEHVGDLTLELAARAFFQVNRAQAARLYALTADLAAPRAGDLVLDLFSGLGGIALTLARRGARVVGVEAQPEAVAAARRAATAAGLDVDFRTGDVAEVLAEVGAADLAVLDPPRKGCAPAVLARLAALAPRRVVYVSCDPGSLARDLARLGALGLRTTSVQPVDLHPGTPHVEAVAVLERA